MLVTSLIIGLDLSNEQAEATLVLFEFDARLQLQDENAERVIEKLALLNTPKFPVYEIVAGKVFNPFSMDNSAE